MGKSLLTFMMFCLIVAGLNAVIVAVLAGISAGPGSATLTFEKWRADDHAFTFMFIFGIDAIAFAVYVLNTIPAEEKKKGE